MTNHVFLLTSNFPYGIKEEFLEEEMKHWAAYPNISVTIFPFVKYDSIRDLPTGIQVNYIFKHSIFIKLLYAIKCCFNRFFWKELITNIRYMRSLINFKSFVGTLAMSCFVKDRLIKAAIPYGAILYSYWFDVQAYGMCLFKLKRNDIKIVTRAHGFDLYRERRINGYMPFKKLFADYFDKIYAISCEGKDYLVNTYDIAENKITVSRLGISKKSTVNIFPKKFHILSCSFIEPVKQLHILIDALSFVKFPVKWTHIGSGSIMSEIVNYAHEKLPDNIEVDFLGYLSNSEVITYYTRNEISCFVNCSKSEGIPVSIMEAQSFGIPVIAPNVGGISEQVNESTGILLPKIFTANDLYLALIDIKKFHNDMSKKAILSHWNKLFYANKNYNDFIYNVMNGCTNVL